jgi:hypothetical protein
MIQIFANRHAVAALVNPLSTVGGLALNPPNCGLQARGVVVATVIGVGRVQWRAMTVDAQAPMVSAGRKNLPAL